MGIKKKRKRKSHQANLANPVVVHVTDASAPSQDLEVRGGHVQSLVPDHVTSPRDLIDLDQDHDTVHIANLVVHECGLDLEIAPDVHDQDQNLMEKNPKTRVKIKNDHVAVVVRRGLDPNLEGSPAG